MALKLLGRAGAQELGRISRTQRRKAAENSFSVTSTIHLIHEVAQRKPESGPSSGPEPGAL